jgi:hypothetical protein
MAFRLQREEVFPQVARGFEIGYILFLSQDSKRPSVPVSVALGMGLTESGLVNSLGLPDRQEVRVTALLESAIGDHLDKHGSPLEVPNYPQVVCDGSHVESLLEREQATDTTCRQYLRAKTYWGWKLDVEHTVFSYSDALRLGVKLKSLLKLAEEEDGHFWTILRHADDSGGFNVKALQALRKYDPGKRDLQVLGALVDVRPLLIPSR